MSWQPDDADEGFLADWYRTIDEVGWGNTSGRVIGEEAARPVPPPSPMLLPQEGDKTRRTFADKIREGILWSADLDHLPDPEPLIENVLLMDTLTWVIGAPANGKSFVVLDWAAHIGSGLPWCGYPVRQGIVLYISPEGTGGVKLRIRAWEAAARRVMEGVGYIPFPVQASDAVQWAGLIEAAAELRPVLIIFDTQARMTVGMNENDAGEMGVFIDRLERLRTATKACVLVVHHTGKSGQIRGSTAMMGAASTIIHVEKEGSVLIVDADPKHNGKTKDAEPFPPVRLRLVPSADSVVPVEEGGQPSTRQADHLSALRSWWEHYEDEPVAARMIVDEMSLWGSRPTFNRDMIRLIRSGVIERVGNGNQTRYRLLRDPG